MLSTVMLLGFTAAAAVTDLLWNKIYNWNTYGGIAAGLGLSAAGSAWLSAEPAAEAKLHRWLGGPAVGDSALGLLVCGVVLIVCFVIFPKVSGGDVKLVAMMGRTVGAGKRNRSHALDLRAGGMCRLDRPCLVGRSGKGKRTHRSAPGEQAAAVLASTAERRGAEGIGSAAMYRIRRAGGGGDREV